MLPFVIVFFVSREIILFVTLGRAIQSGEKYQNIEHNSFIPLNHGASFFYGIVLRSDIGQ